MLRTEANKIFLSNNRRKQKSPAVYSSSISGSSDYNSQFTPPNSISKKVNNINIEPSSTLNSNLSFEGSLLKSFKRLYSVSITDFDNSNVDKAIKHYGEIFGESAKKHLIDVKDGLAKKNTKGIEFADNKIIFKEEPLLKEVFDGAIYPIVKFPLDVANGVVSGLRKIPALKDNQTLANLQKEDGLLTKRLNEIEDSLNITSLKGYLSDFDSKKDELVEHGLSFFDKNRSKYNTIFERTGVRATTGLVGSFFVANDAYNLSRLVNDNPKEAKFEKKKRFKQEVSRIGLNMYLQFITLSALSKYINKSLPVAIGVIAGTSFLSETLGRVMSKTPILPLTKSKSKEIKKKEIIEAKPINFESNGEKENRKPNIAKFALYTAGILGAGYGITKFKSTKIFKNIDDIIKNNKIVQKDVSISVTEFNKIKNKLHKNGFGEIADNLDNIISGKPKDDGTISLGKIDRNIGKSFVNNVLLMPFKLVSGAISLPYKALSKSTKIISKLSKGESIVAKTPKSANKLAEENFKAARKSLEYLSKYTDVDDEVFKKKVSKEILRGLDNTNRKDYKNSDLGVLAKLSVSTISGAYLALDNYNIVMKRSNGEDQDLAVEKAKARAVQRGVKTTYSACIIKFFNDLFSTAYNSNLLVAVTIPAFTSAIEDALARVTIGMPLTEKSRDDIMEIENKNLNAKGLKGKFFKTMAYITGKKSLSKRIESPAKISETKEVPNFTSLNSNPSSRNSMDDFLKSVKV